MGRKLLLQDILIFLVFDFLSDLETSQLLVSGAQDKFVFFHKKIIFLDYYAALEALVPPKESSACS